MAKRGQAVRRSPTRSKVPTKPKRPPADVDLKKENAALRLELADALERQTATSEVLQVISSARPATWSRYSRKCWRTRRAFAAPNLARWTLRKGTPFGVVALYNVPLSLRRCARGTDVSTSPERRSRHVIRTQQVAHIEDIRANLAYLEGDPSIVAISDLAGARTIVTCQCSGKTN